MKTRFLSAVLLVACVLLPFWACSKPKPIKIGFLGGLSGRVADLGVSGRNGVMLAVEEANSRGGIKGRPVELLAMDDEQSPQTAVKALNELLAQQVEVIIGPMTSSVAMATLDGLNASGTIMVSPTVTTTQLKGKDDNFLRVISVTTDYASKNAAFQYDKLGTRTVAAIYDNSNKSYTQSWLNDFKAAFEGKGGKLVKEIPFESRESVVFGDLVKDTLTSKPDCILIITNAVDSATICQQIRKVDQKVAIAMSEWASTERFVELAGASAEGVIVSQFLDRRDTSAKYLAFSGSFKERFKQDPGFAGLASYDAALVVFEALASQKSGESLKKTILEKKSFDCTQQVIHIDEFGDADRKTYLTKIENGQYVTLE